MVNELQKCRQSLNYRSYFNRQTEIFLQAFQESLSDGVDIDVISLLDRFILQMNYPLIHTRLINSTHVLVRDNRVYSCSNPFIRIEYWTSILKTRVCEKM